MAILTLTRQRAVVHVVANSTFVVAGNNSVSNIATPTEIVYGASVSRVWFGTDPAGTWKILRGANVVYVASGAGYHYFDSSTLSVDSTANVVCQLSGSANGFMMIELHKEGNNL